MRSNKEAPIKLPSPSRKGAMSVEEAISRRRSIRKYKAEPLSLAQLSQVLWSAQGITRGSSRAAPSAGATYPLEVFVLTGKTGVEGLGEGVYHYNVESHSLSLQQEGDLRGNLAAAALEEEFIAIAPVDIVVCGIYDRTCRRYGKRGERYVHIEVGHVGENIHLQAEALGLATVAVGAFEDEGVRRVLDVKEEVKPLYIMPLGKSLYGGDRG